MKIKRYVQDPQFSVGKFTSEFVLFPIMIKPKFILSKITVYLRWISWSFCLPLYNITGDKTIL